MNTLLKRIGAAPPPLLAAALLLLGTLAFACGKGKVAEPESDAPANKPGPARTSIAETSNLIAFAKGAVVIDRTGELELSSSPVYANDDSEQSAWITPPKDPDHTVTFALPVRSRVARVGVSTGMLPERTRPPKQVVFEGSADGSTFLPLATIDSSKRKNEQLADVAPRELTHIRATIADGSTEIVAIGSLLAVGEEIARYDRPSIAGEWELNGLPARFGQSGARVWGQIDMSPPMRIEGGWHDRTIRFIYLRGKEYGYGTIVVSPDGGSLNARLWYEEVIPLFRAVPQFGRRVGEGASPAGWEVTAGWLKRFKRVPMYGIQYDANGAVDSAASADSLGWLAAREDLISLVKREYGLEDAEENLALSRRQIESLRSALAARGVDVSPLKFEPLGTTGHKESPATRVERPLFSRVEAVSR